MKTKAFAKRPRVAESIIFSSILDPDLRVSASSLSKIPRRGSIARGGAAARRFPAGLGGLSPANLRTDAPARSPVILAATLGRGEG
jgi:hypothetical protein